MQFEDITPGESWACRFRIETLCDDKGEPVDTRNLQVGQRVVGTPQTYESIGVIETRDTERRLLRLRDHRTQQQYVVSADNAWDYDRVKYT